VAAPPTHRFTAAFVDRALEAQYARESFEQSTRPVTRFTVTLSAVIFLSYGVHDAFIMPGALVREAWAIRYGLSVPMFAVVLPLMWTRFYTRWHRPARLFFAFTISAVVLALGAIAGGEPAALQTSWAPLFLVLGPFIARFDVVSELAYAMVTLLLYNALTLALGHGDVVVAVSINMAIVSMGLIGVLVARQMERQAREVFFQGRTIQAQMEALDAEKQSRRRCCSTCSPRPSRSASSSRTAPSRTVSRTSRCSSRTSWGSRSSPSASRPRRSSAG
jgi:hypothetical protein